MVISARRCHVRISHEVVRARGLDALHLRAIDWLQRMMMIGNRRFLFTLENQRIGAAAGGAIESPRTRNLPPVPRCYLPPSSEARSSAGRTEHIPDDPVICNLENGRILVLVDGHNIL
jgi:hypothetical protein